ncbi:MAG TPA: hypothetical protein PLD54_03015 [Candidatus Levybacteria bacterium]|nr:hypothetical protein [Candidatus Levybacteria bacterium]
MKNRILKFCILIFLPLIPMMSISNATLLNTEITKQNIFKADSLDFELTNQNGDTHTGLFFDKKKLKKDEVMEKNIFVTKKGDLNFYYYPEFKYISGNDEVCDELTLIAQKEGNEVYSGSLSEFNLATESAQITGNADEWKFIVTHTNENKELQGDSCKFDIQFLAFQNLDKSGFSDTEKVSSSIGIAYEPKLTAKYNSSTHKFIFTLSNLTNFTSFEYELMYDTDTVPNGILGSETFDDIDKKTISKLLGTCSDDGCTYQPNPHNFTLTIELADIDGEKVTVSKNL